MPYDLKSMKLLAQGGQADIYEIDDGRILRVLRDSDPGNAGALKNEHIIMNALHKRGLGVPEVFEYVEVDGRPALAMERVAGPAMLDGIFKNPLRLRGTARELARLHSELLGNPAPEAFMEIKKEVDIIIDRSEYIDDADRAFVRSLMDDLPGGGTILHGDFHPGNILTQENRYYIIDWFLATKGDAVADVANTYLMCAHVPRIPSFSALKHGFLKAIAGMLGRIYLKEMQKRLGFSMEVFGRWTAVRAAQRTYHGLPSEFSSRANYVKACSKMHLDGVSSERWYRKI